jgi:hypothetical protein
MNVYHRVLTARRVGGECLAANVLEAKNDMENQMLSGLLMGLGQRLTQLDETGFTLLHSLAMYGSLHTVPREILNAENLLVRDAEGETVLHVLASGGFLGMVPREVLTSANLLVRNLKGETVLYCAAFRGNLLQLPRECWTAESVSVTRPGGFTVLYAVMLSQALDQLPGKCLTQTTLLARCSAHSDGTPLHVAASVGLLYLIPTGLLTSENLLIKNRKGQTPLLFAAKRGFLAQVPEHLLTQENLLMRDAEGHCPLLGAAESATLGLIPPGTLDYKLCAEALRGCDRMAVDPWLRAVAKEAMKRS